MRKRTTRSGLTLIELIVLLAIIGILIALLLPAVQAAREAARRTQCSNHLKQLALGLLNYEAVHRSYPATAVVKGQTATAPVPGSPRKDGVGAGFSWLVAVLPFLEQQPLYEMIDFKGAPYDGARDHKMAASVQIATYRCPSFAGSTFAQAPEYPVGSQALTNYAGLGASHLASLYGTEKDPVGGKKHPNGVLAPGCWVHIGEILDGTSNTLMVCETREEKYAAWFDGTNASLVALAEQTTPAFDGGGDSPYQPKAGARTTLNYGDPMPPEPTAYLPAKSHSGREDWVHGPSSQHPGIVNHAFCDGSVQAIDEMIDPAVYMSLSTRAGTEATRRPDF